MIEGQQGVTWEQWVALARTCEESGIEALFRSDHYIGFHAPDTNGSLDCWTTLAALAAVTTTLRLGSLVSPVTFRHPSVLAKAAATADHVSGGRVELGIGGGWMEREHAAYGFAFPETPVRMEMLAEQIEIVHRQWTEEQLRLRRAPLPTRRQHRDAEAGAGSAPAADRRRRGALRHARPRRALGRRVQHDLPERRRGRRAPTPLARGVRTAGPRAAALLDHDDVHRRRRSSRVHRARTRRLRARRASRRASTTGSRACVAAASSARSTRSPSGCNGSRRSASTA